MKAALTFALLWICGTACSQQLRFRIVSQDGGPVANALVELSNDTAHYHTDAWGNIEVRAPSDSFVSIRVTKEGMRPVEMTHDRTVLYGFLVIPVCPPCRYDDNSDVCPKCRKRNRVLPVVYGLPVGKQSAAVYYGGCEISCCDPKHYCRRDKLLF